jgi:hypothetical protein
MNNKYAMLLLGLVFFACGQDKADGVSTNDDIPVNTGIPNEQPSHSTEQLDPENLQEQARDLFGENTINAEAAGLVNVETLKAILPADLNGMPRAQLLGEAASAMGFNVVEVTGVYTTSKGENLTIDILDTGGLPPAVLMFAGWAKSEVDRQTPNGHEKTAYLGEQKILEKSNPAGNRSEVSTLVNMRYVVKLRARNMTVEELRDALTALGLDKFDHLQ